MRETEDGTPADWHEPVDAEIDEAAERILAWDGAVPADIFARIYAGQGRLAWIHGADALDEPRLRFLLGHWQALAAQCGGVPQRRAIDPVDLKPMLGSLMMLEVERDGYDAVYRLYGTEIAESGAGRDWTGFRVSELVRQMRAPAALLARACYLAVKRRPAPLYCEHVPPRYQGVGAWKRLILPLADGQNDCARYLVGNLAVDRRFLSDQELRVVQDLVRRSP